MPDNLNTKQMLSLLQDAARYAVNRLDSMGYSQVAGDLAIALASTMTMEQYDQWIKERERHGR